MRRWLTEAIGRGQTAWRRLVGVPSPIPDALWRDLIGSYPFLGALDAREIQQLRTLCEHFLHTKEFSGAHGLVVTDPMALAVAAQACLLWVHQGPQGLRWYDGFVGIVLHRDEAIAERERPDAIGVIHRYRETLAGEAMHGGPLMLAWSHVRAASADVAGGHNLVIHEFAHAIDMRYKAAGEMANGCPQLPAGFMGLSAAEAHRRWHDVWAPAYTQLVTAVEMSERFGAAPPWLDAYGATSPAEFFAVVCEAYAVNRPRLLTEYPEITRLLDAFFRRPTAINDATTP